MTSSDLLTILEHGISFDAAAKFAYDLGWALADDIINKRGKSSSTVPGARKECGPEDCSRSTTAMTTGTSSTGSTTSTC